MDWLGDWTSAQTTPGPCDSQGTSLEPTVGRPLLMLRTPQAPLDSVRAPVCWQGPDVRAPQGRQRLADMLLSVSLRQQDSPRTAQGAASASEAPRQPQDPCTGTKPESVTPSRRRDCPRSDSGRSGAALRIGFGVRTTLASDPTRVGELRRRIRKSGTHLGADSVGIADRYP